MSVERRLNKHVEAVHYRHTQEVVPTFVVVEVLHEFFRVGLPRDMSPIYRTSDIWDPSPRQELLLNLLGLFMGTRLPGHIVRPQDIGDSLAYLASIFQCGLHGYSR